MVCVGSRLHQFPSIYSIIDSPVPRADYHLHMTYAEWFVSGAIPQGSIRDHCINKMAQQMELRGRWEGLFKMWCGEKKKKTADH